MTTKTILVIEDDKSVVLMLEDVLKSEGFTVLVERDGEFGLRTFQEKQVDLIVVDVLIPKIKGFDLITRLRETERGKNLPIVVISGVYRAQNHKERIVQKHRVVEYLDKPVDIDKLIDVLHDVFSSAYPVPEMAAAEPEPAPAPTIVPLARKETLPPPPPALLAVSDRGNIEDVPFARLLGNLFAARATGQLLLKKGSVKKIVYLRQGIPVFVKSNLVTECLGQVMVAEKMISEDECKRSLEKKKASGKRQGEVLVEMGSISPHNLEFALELQLQTKLYDMFSWLEGEYQFVAKDDFAGQAVALSLGPTAMIYEGASRTMSAERIERDLERIHELAVVPAKDPTFRYQALELDPRAERLLDRIDGLRSVKKLLESADFDFEDAALLMYALSCTGLLQVAGSAQALEPVAEPIELGADDVQMLSTNEINPAQELAKLTHASALFDDAPAAANDGAAQLDARAFAPPAPPAATPVAQAIDAAPVSAAAAALEVADWSAASSPPESAPIASTPPAPSIADDLRAPLPALRSNPAPSGAPRPAPVANAASTSTPALSDELRRQVRARLEAEAAKMISQRPQPAAPIPSSAPKKLPSSPKNPPKKETPKLDLERDHARTKRELTDTLERLSRADLYDVLGVSKRASLEDLHAAHQKLLKDHHPDRVLAGSLSRELRSIAERIMITVERAHAVLSDPQARKSYDLQTRIDNGDSRIAPLVSAEQAFTRGKEALEKNELMTAREAFYEATEKSPQEGTYFAYLGLAIFLMAPKDENSKNLALEALDKAMELAPLNEEVYLFRGTIQQRIGNRGEAAREMERAVRCNPDSVPALEALRVLEPPQQKKTGFLSRLTSG